MVDHKISKITYVNLNYNNFLVGKLYCRSYSEEKKFNCFTVSSLFINRSSGVTEMSSYSIYTLILRMLNFLNKFTNFLAKTFDFNQ